jgi:hypothetical protein
MHVLVNQVPKKETGVTPELGREDRQPCLSPELSELRAYQTYLGYWNRVIGPISPAPSLEQWRRNQAHALAWGKRQATL